MNEIQTALLSLLPPKRKQTPSGWISMNAVCCHHRGEKTDTRGRGGLYVKPDGGWTYHCFNCQFKAGWTPGHFLPNNSKQLFSWLGLSDTDIQKLNLEAIRLRENNQKDRPRVDLDFVLEERELPDNSHSLDYWLELPDPGPELLDAVEYILNRGMQWHWYPWHWSPEPGYRDRVILPFYADKKIVGWTARKIKPGKPKYLTSAQPGYVFNLDRQSSERKFVIVVEGQFDAIALDGVAIMHNEPNATQCARINALAREVIVVPDRDRAGTKLIEAALAQGWYVSLPDWESDIKDVADAVKRYGRLYTMTSVLNSKETNTLKIQILKKQLEQKYETDSQLHS